MVVDTNTKQERILTFADACSIYGRQLDRSQLEKAYRIAGKSFFGQLEQFFVVLNDKDASELEQQQGQAQPFWNMDMEDDDFFSESTHQAAQQPQLQSKTLQEQQQQQQQIKHTQQQQQLMLQQQHLPPHQQQQQLQTSDSQQPPPSQNTGKQQKIDAAFRDQRRKAERGRSRSPNKITKT